jgi:transcriptional regulator with XRE-family HTH domain
LTDIDDEIPQEYIQEAHKTIGNNVKRIRESKKLSQLDLSHKIGHKSVSVVSCAEINHKNHHFNIEHLLKIAYVLDVDVCQFFNGTEKNLVENEEKDSK